MLRRRIIMKCLKCGQEIIDGNEYVGIKEKNFCSMDCARNYIADNPGDAIDHYISDYAQIYDHEFENPYA